MGLTRITSDGITDATIATADLADQSVTLAKLPHGTSSNDGKFLRANNGADPTFETVNTDLSADTSPQLGGNLDANTKNIFFGDSSSSSNNRLQFGVTDKDLQLYHDGSNSYVSEAGTGNLILGTGGSQVHIHNTTNNEPLAKFISNGAVELYYDSSVKLATINGGISVTGGVNTTGASSFNGDIFFGDSTKAIFGDGSDLKIFHDGSKSIIDDNFGEFQIRSDHIIIEKSDGSETYIDCQANGSVELYHNNVKKFETISLGVQVTGEISHLAGTYENASGGYVRVKHDSGRFTCGGGNDLHLYHDGSNGYLENRTGDFYLKANVSDTGIKVINNGAVELYHDNTLSFQTNASGASLVDGDNTVAFGLITGNGQSGYLVGISNDTILIQSGTGETMAGFNKDGSADLYHNGTKKFETTSSGAKMSSGHFYPANNGSQDLGLSGNRWRNVYTNDLHLSNEGKSNDVDGTWGSYTIQEGAEDLFLVNKRNGKKYKFNLTEVS